LDLGLVNLGVGKDLAADKLALQYVGAAAMVEWEALPAEARALLHHRATKLAGLEAMTGLQEQISSLFRRNQRKF
jgi:hypothetical protein